MEIADNNCLLGGNMRVERRAQRRPHRVFICKYSNSCLYNIDCFKDINRKQAFRT